MPAARFDHLLWHPYTEGSIAYRLRTARWKLLEQRFPDIGSMRVLDVGGVAESWLGAPCRPAELVLLNLHHYTPESPEPWMTTLVGDACAPGATLRKEKFDLVFSNSVIEHVGGHWRRERFAGYVREAAPHYWVQTPNRYFPIEPHWVFPGAQFLPASAKRRLTMHWPIGNYGGRRDRSQAMQDVMEVELIGPAQMRYYFPDAELIRELGPIAKSLIACR